MSTYRQYQNTPALATIKTPGADDGSLSMLTDWDEAKTAAFQKEILSFGHSLAATGLFSDEALIELLSKHPAELLDVCTMGDPDHPVYPNKFRTGDFREASPETLLEAAKSGCVWINARRAMNVHPEYKAVLDAMYGEIARETEQDVFNANGGILISSPIARVPYHCDKTETILWHVRGQKRIYIYPCTEEFIPETAYESTLTDLICDDLPYDRSMDAAAQMFDLEPGQAICWPLNSPHRVDNSAFCVSVTTEYSTKESALRNSAMLTNAVMRAKLGLNPSYARDGAITRRTKSVIGRALNKTGITRKTTRPDYVTFTLDPSVEGFLVDTDPYIRSF